jgi:hypothetical protein
MLVINFSSPQNDLLIIFYVDLCCCYSNIYFIVHLDFDILIEIDKRC